MSVFTLMQRQRRAVVGAGVSAAAVMLLTAFHHMYGAVIYQTPWRNHMVEVSLWATAFIIAALFVFYRKQSSTTGRVAFWLATAAIALIPVGVVGLFEGVYNHLLKNLLFFSGAPITLLHELFPPPTYHLPNNVIFEVTGVLQAFVAGAAAYYNYRLFAIGAKTTKTPKKATPNKAMSN